MNNSTCTYVYMYTVLGAGNPTIRALLTSSGY